VAELIEPPKEKCRNEKRQIFNGLEAESLGWIILVPKKILFKIFKYLKKVPFISREDKLDWNEQLMCDV
jgi:hypothetical protein